MKTDELKADVLSQSVCRLFCGAPHSSGFQWQHLLLPQTQNLQGKKLIRNFQNVETYNAEDMRILPTVQRHSPGAKGTRNVCWCTGPGVGNWICYSVWVTTLRNATGFFMWEAAFPARPADWAVWSWTEQVRKEDQKFDILVTELLHRCADKILL